MSVRSRDGDFQKPIVLPLAGRHAPVFLGALDKLHTHFVLSELHQEPRRREPNTLRGTQSRRVCSNPSFPF